MPFVQSSRHIDAPLERVFSAIADVRNFSEAVPHVTNIEFLTESRTGTGTRFRETRENNGRIHTVELEVAEYVSNERVRMVSDAGGTIWDTVFTVNQTDDGVEMAMEMDARPYRLLARLMTVAIRGMVAKAVEADMDAVKVWCESPPSGHGND